MFNRTVYIMRSYLIGRQFDQHYPGIKLEKGKRGFFSSLRKAEKAIREIVRHYADNANIDTYAFHVMEIPYNCQFKDTILGERLYDANGNLVDKTLRADVSCYDTKQFPEDLCRYPGRTPEQIRFQVGDLVEVLSPRDGTTKLMIVGRVPFAPEKVKALENDPEDPSTDIPDEYACYDPLEGKKFLYYPPTRLMAPTFPLDESVKETYRKYMAEAAEKRIVPRRTW